MTSSGRDYRVVFVGGVHGVGKTSLCRRLAADAGATHLSASSLIVGGEHVGKLVDSVADNQRRLVRALRSYESPTPLLLLDGHFALLTTSGIPQAVPMWTFREIAPSGLILLMAPVAAVRTRLLARDESGVGADDVGALQEQEATSAAKIAESLRLPLLSISGLDDLDDTGYQEARLFLQRFLVSPGSE